MRSTMAIHEDPPAGMPEWIVTFGDMMSLLLTFFVMMVSMSEIKSPEKYDAMADSMRRQFGYGVSSANWLPSWAKPRNAAIAAVTAAERARKFELASAGQKTRPTDDRAPVRVVRPGTKTSVGISIFFDDSEVELSAANRDAIHMEALEFGGKLQKIEIRGHTGNRPVSANSGYDDLWALAYARCHRTMRLLVDELSIEPQRIRIAVAGPHEPVHSGTDPNKLRQNDRVEIYLLDEIVTDLSETGTEQQ